jgi:hypothetical protein
MNRFTNARSKPIGYFFSAALLCAALIACNQNTDVAQPDDSTGLVPASANTHQHPLPSLSNQPSPDKTIGAVDGPKNVSATRVLPGIATIRSKPRTLPVGVTPKVKLKLLVVAATSDETTLAAITTFLKQIGTPFDTLIASTTDLTQAYLEAEVGLGNYNGVLLTTANLAWSSPTGFVSAFTPTEWAMLRAYEADYKAREVDLYSYPDGIDNTYPGNTGLVATGAVDTTSAALNAQLTSKGQQIFPFLQPAINIPIRYAYTYTATVTGNAVPVMTTASGVVAALNVTPADGREVLSLTMAHNPYLTHSVLLSYGLIRWVSRGMFLGEKQMYFATHVDDVFIPNDVWSPAQNANSLTAQFRLRPSDLDKTVTWQKNFRLSHSRFSSFKLDFLFNGLPFNDELPGGGFDPSAPNTCGRVPAGKDAFTSRAKCYKSNFRWMNHTLTHTYLDSYQSLPVGPYTNPATSTNPYVAGTNAFYNPATTNPAPSNPINGYTAVIKEIGDNIAIAKGATGLNLIGNEFDGNSLVIGNHSGIGYEDEPTNKENKIENWGKSHANPALILGAEQYGIQFLGANTSAPTTVATGCTSTAEDCNQNNPTPNTGVWLNAANLPANNIMLVPRFPVNIFYNTYIPELLVNEYNHLYFNFWGRNFTIDEIMEQEANTAIDHILTGSYNPHYFHQTNLCFYPCPAPPAGTPAIPAYPAGSSLLTTFVDRVAQKYESWINLPVKTLSMTELGLKMKARLAYDNAAASAVWDRAAGVVTISGAAGVNIPLTNPAFGTPYGPDFVRYTQAGEAVTVGQGI